MPRVLAALAAVALLAALAPAYARGPVRRGRRVRAAERPRRTPPGPPPAMLRAAVAYWGERRPLCGTPRFVWTSSVAAGIQADSWAYTQAGSCSIFLVRGRWPGGDYALACRLVVHEYSHLLGIPDYGTGTITSHAVARSLALPPCDRALRESRTAGPSSGVSQPVP